MVSLRQKFSCHSILVLAAAIGLGWTSLNKAAETNKTTPRSTTLQKALTNDQYQAILINNLMSYYGNNGSASYNPYSGNAGFEFPKGGNKYAIYKDGLVWGGIQGGTIKVGGSTYSHGLQAGKILVPGTASTPPVADNATLPKYRVFRVRPDINPTTPLESVRDRMSKEVEYISRFENVTEEQLYSQYLNDWNEWPAADGAPFVDVNGNKVYEPTIDVAGMPGADQTLWHVSNDLDGVRTVDLYGSEPIGLEMQRTVWAYNTAGALGNIIFIGYRIINKSGALIDSMYFSQWSDPDLGNANDDFVGCDTTLSLGFAYNAADNDAVYGFAPPAVGFDFFQGPMVPGSPSDTAIFLGSYHPGYRNLPMSSFNFFSIGDPVHSDPVERNIEGTYQWYRLMQGLVSTTGEAYIDPTKGNVTKFVMAGDPVNGAGWIDGMLNGPGDRRMVMTTGPFTMADGDTQEVVVAAIAAQGVNRRSSVAALRTEDRFAQQMYDSFFTVAPPSGTTQISYPNAAQAAAKITVMGGIPKPDQVRAILKRADETIIAALDLFDDGLHGDGGAGDKIFTNTVTITRELAPIHLDAEVTALNEVYSYQRLQEAITIAGHLEIDGPFIFSDNLNDNHEVNPGENIRYGFDISNATPFDLRNLSVNGANEDGRVLPIAELNSGQQYAWNYDPTNSQSYFSFTVPTENKDYLLPIPITISDDLFNVWRDTIYFSIKRVARLAYGTPVTHISGPGRWSFSTAVVDRPSLTNHAYEISVEKPADMKTMNLRDLATGSFLLVRHPLPDESGHNIPVTAGFKVLQGENWGKAGLDKDSTLWISSYPAWFAGVNRFNQDSHSAFQGGITTGYQLGAVPYLGHVSSSFDHESSVRVELRFDAAKPQKAYRLRRTGPNTEYQLQTSVLPAAPNGEPFVNVPFQVWDMSDPAHSRQLTVSWRDQNDNATWDPPVGSNDGLEFVYIHYRTYDPSGRQFTYPANPVRPGDVVDNQLTVGAEADIMYGLSLGVRDGHVLNENPGTLLLVPFIGLTTEDRFIFKPAVPPPTPSLGDPLDNTSNYSVEFWGWWRESEGADFYRLQISKDSPLFNHLVFDDSTITENWAPRDTVGSDIRPRIKLDFGSTYYWRVKAKNPYGWSSWSAIWNFTTRLANVPLAWRRLVSQTGNNATIAVAAAIHPRIGNRPLRTGDAVGVFFSRNDSLICAGYDFWKEGENMAIIAWGDDNQTSRKDGFAIGEPIRFKIWDAVAAREHPATATFASGGSVYTPNGIYVLQSLIGIASSHDILLPAGWNMISSYVAPSDTNLASMFAPVAANMMVMKNGKGQIYWPSLSINTIGTWNFKDGYQLYMQSADTIKISGEEVVPQSIPIYLRAGWNLAAYLRKGPMTPDTALATIADHLVIVKNSLGKVYWPQLSVNTIGQMQAGQGYQIYLSANATLIYPANNTIAAANFLATSAGSKKTGDLPPALHYQCGIAPTGANAVLAVQSTDLADGDEVAVWSHDKKLVAAGIVNHGTALITVWGDNELTDNQIEGVVESEELSLTSWSSKTKCESTLSITGVKDMLAGAKAVNGLSYCQDAVWIVTVAGVVEKPTVFSLSQNYPNPFNSATTIKYGLPQDVKVRLEVFNVLGQRVAILLDEKQKAGYHDVIFDNSHLSSGSYFYRLSAGSFVKIKKMLVLK